MTTWIQSHKALIGAIAAGLVAAAPFVPVPYNAIPLGVATILGALIGAPVATKAAAKLKARFKQ